MTNLNRSGKHDFTKPDGAEFGEHEHISIDVGFYKDLINNVKYRAKKSADKRSYVWDRLIETFTNHMLNGTTIVPEGGSNLFSDLEEAVRYMTLVPRYLRRLYGEAILDALEKGRKAHRFTRAIMPSPNDRDRDTGFFFMTLAVPIFELEGGYEPYRLARRNMLETYALTFLQLNPHVKQVVGIATEPPSDNPEMGSSEDLILVGAPEWSPEVVDELEERKKLFDVTKEGNYKTYEFSSYEYPEISEEHIGAVGNKMNRLARRARASRARHR